MLRLPLHLALWLWFLCVIASPCLGTAIVDEGRTSRRETQLEDILSKRSLSNGITLRILPLGASITYGLMSTEGNGYRYALRNQLVYSGNPVNMIGSVNAGTMADDQCEGWPGYRIDQVATKAQQDFSSKPNLVLLHIGTNDCVQSYDVAGAGSRLESLINQTFSAIPDVTIIASTLLPNANDNTQSNINIFNPQIPKLVKGLQSQGRKITYVDFSSSWWSVDDLGSDGTHPTDAGYEKMAEVWYQGIQVAANQGWLKAPATVSGVDDTYTGGNTTCNKVPGAAVGPIQVQRGSGSDDGAYVHVGKQVYGTTGYTNPSSVNFNNSLPEGVFWGDIDGDGIDDYIYVGSNTKYGLGVALSVNGGGQGKYLFSNCSVSCNRPGVHFTDITGDGRDDLCCVGPDGGLSCWENTAGSDARSPNWVSLGVVKASEGYPQAQVRLADIDGDGRTDYVVIDTNSSNIYGWRNGALQPGPPAYWYAMNGVFIGLPAMDLSGWRFVDLNGDHKDDLVWVSPNGAVTTWINRRGFGVGLTPRWVSHGVTHQGSSSPVNVTFGTFMGSGRADYALVSVNDQNLVAITRYQNNDHGGTMVRGDGTYYCDMTGSGSDDYLFINETGAISLFENYHNWGYWNPWGVIVDASYPREQIHLADYDGDGRCDILLVDKYTGHTTMLQNNFANGQFAFKNVGVVSEQTDCKEGFGHAKHDRGVRWADIDGDGRADYLCMQTDGTTTGWLNKKNGMVSQGLIKHTEGKERVNLRFADINGDGRADFLYVNMLNGSVTVWYNGGAIQSSGSAFQWNYAGVVSTGGSSRGECVEFGELYGEGRADYINVEPATNKAWAFFNVCPGGGRPPAVPNLPSGAPDPPKPGVTTTATTSTRSTTTSPPQPTDTGDDPDDKGVVPRGNEFPPPKQIVNTYMRPGMRAPRLPGVFYNVAHDVLNRTQIRAVAAQLNAVTLYDVYYEDDNQNAPFNPNFGAYYAYNSIGRLRDWFRYTSRVFAQVLQNNVAYIIWDGQQAFENNPAQIPHFWTAIWASDEFDAIFRGQTAIDTVYRVDPVTLQQILIWRRGQAPPRGWLIPERGANSESNDTANPNPNGPTVLAASPSNSAATPKASGAPKSAASSQSAASPKSTGGSKTAKRYVAVPADLIKRSDAINGISQAPDESVFSPGQTDPWVPGRCSFHWNQTFELGVPGPYYFDVYLYDDAQTNLIGDIAVQPINGGDQTAMFSRLQWALIINPSGPARDPVTFKYADLTWTSDDSDHCSTGDYDSSGGYVFVRNGDCSFPCNQFQ